MIHAAAAIAPTAPGQTGKGTASVGGDLFALSLSAIGTEAQPADPAAAPATTDTPRQALAVPGMPLPSGDSAAIDPALAWLPAVNIAVPAPLDIPPALVATTMPTMPTAGSPSPRNEASAGVLAATLPAPSGTPVAGDGKLAAPRATAAAVVAAAVETPPAGFRDATLDPDTPAAATPDRSTAPDTPPRPYEPAMAGRVAASDGDRPSPAQDRTVIAEAVASASTPRNAEAAESPAPAAITAVPPPLESQAPVDLAAPVVDGDTTILLPATTRPVHAAAVRAPRTASLSIAESAPARRDAMQEDASPGVASDDEADPSAPASPTLDPTTALPIAMPLAAPDSPTPAPAMNAKAEPPAAQIVPDGNPTRKRTTPPVNAAGGPARDDAAAGAARSDDRPTLDAGTSRPTTVTADPAIAGTADAPAPAQRRADRSVSPTIGARPAPVVTETSPLAGDPASPQLAAPASATRTAPQAEALPTVPEAVERQTATSDVRGRTTGPAAMPMTAGRETRTPSSDTAAPASVGTDAAPAMPKTGTRHTAGSESPMPPVTVPMPGEAAAPTASSAPRPPSASEDAPTPAVTGEAASTTVSIRPAAAARPQPAAAGMSGTTNPSATVAEPMPAYVASAAPNARETASDLRSAAAAVATSPSAPSRPRDPATSRVADRSAPAITASDDVATAPATTIDRSPPPGTSDGIAIAATRSGDPAPASSPVRVAAPPTAASTAGVAARRMAPSEAAQPVVAAAAPVAVAGGPIVTPAATPSAAATPVASAPRRQTFVREVSGTTRQTVALRPQAMAPARQPAAGTTAPAAEVFGAAMHAASTDERERSQPLAPTIAAAPAATDVRPVATVADTAQPTLDMRQGQWPTAMIDHIERLRDAADAQDTRIRLVPDALGAIDVSVKSVGDAIHVRFAAEDATTRALIEDASPRLAQIAEERGLRIGQTVVESAPSTAPQQQPGGQSSNGQPSGQSPSGQTPSGGQQQSATQAQTGQQQPRQQQSSTARQPDRPARAPTRDTDAAADGRVA